MTSLSEAMTTSGSKISAPSSFPTLTSNIFGVIVAVAADAVFSATLRASRLSAVSMQSRIRSLEGNILVLEGENRRWLAGEIEKYKKLLVCSRETAGMWICGGNMGGSILNFETLYSNF